MINNPGEEAEIRPPEGKWQRREVEDREDPSSTLRKRPTSSVVEVGGGSTANIATLEGGKRMQAAPRQNQMGPDSVAIPQRRVTKTSSTSAMKSLHPIEGR